jgi:hypothetical protein
LFKRQGNLGLLPQAAKVLPQVDIVVNYAGADGEPVRSLIAAGKTQGLVVAGFGGGTVSGTMFEALKEARAKRLSVVITGAPAGRLYTSSASPGSVLMTKSIGCVIAQNLSPKKAHFVDARDAADARHRRVAGVLRPLSLWRSRDHSRSRISDLPTKRINIVQFRRKQRKASQKCQQSA